MHWVGGGILEEVTETRRRYRRGNQMLWWIKEPARSWREKLNAIKEGQTKNMTICSERGRNLLQWSRRNPENRQLQCWRKRPSPVKGRGGNHITSCSDRMRNHFQWRQGETNQMTSCCDKGWNHLQWKQERQTSWPVALMEEGSISVKERKTNITTSCSEAGRDHLQWGTSKPTTQSGAVKRGGNQPHIQLQQRREEPSAVKLGKTNHRTNCSE